jgi:hypothetical protein
MEVSDEFQPLAASLPERETQVTTGDEAGGHPTVVMEIPAPAPDPDMN